MDGDGAAGLLAEGEKSVHNQIGRRAAVGEEEVAVLEAGAGEARRVVDALVQPDDGCHVVLAEIVEVRLGSVLACQSRNGKIK